MTTPKIPTRVDIVVSLYDTTEHPQKLLRRLGVTYFKAVPQSLGECWWFFNCRSLPDPLPAALQVRDFGDLGRLVGFGLATEDVREIYEDRGGQP